MKNEICSPVDIQLRAGIYTSDDTNISVDLLTTKIDIDSIYALTMEDNNLYLNASQIDKISFPLNDATNESSFVLCKGTTKDTISFIYDKHLIFNSIKCGVYNTYTITDIVYTTNFLQEIILTKPEINEVSAENIQLVF